MKIIYVHARMDIMMIALKVDFFFLYLIFIILIKILYIFYIECDI